jgi:cytochrome c-type biogenesis protein
MACYCLGLGIPFVLVALGFGWVSSALGFVRRHRRAVSAFGGALLITIGVLLVTGAWDHLVAELQTRVSSVGFDV